MKQSLFLLLILFACTKEKQEPKCWECIEKSNSTIVNKVTECDILKATEQNGKRWITYVWVGNVYTATVHTITCK
jgi:hypothetical protein